VEIANPWQLTKKSDPAVARMADDHYSRKTRGAIQFNPPGRVLTLYIPGPEWPFRAAACWCWWDGISGDGNAGFWHNTLFRNESADYLSSDLIQAAVERVNEVWGEPLYGYDTYVWPEKLRSPRPGACYRIAGWQRGGFSKDGKKQRLYFPVSASATLPDRLAKSPKTAS
jgi:hypothetical protein